MTKTKALEKLYKAITGKPGRNSESKIIEDIADGVESGAIVIGGLEFESGTWIPDEDTTHGTIPLNKRHSKPPVIALVWDPSETVTSLEDEVARLSFQSFIDLYQMRGDSAVPTTQAAGYCGQHIYSGWGSTGSQVTKVTASNIYNPYTEGYYDSAKYTKYFAEEDKIHPYGSNFSCKAGHTYNWLAIWI